MDALDLLDFATNLAHDTGACVSLCATPLGKVQGAAVRISLLAPMTFRGDSPCAGQQSSINDLARVVLLGLFETGESVHKLLLAFLQGGVVILLVLFPDLVPILWVLGLVGLGSVLHGELALDDFEPYLARLTFDLRRVELELAELSGIVDAEEDVSDGFVG